MRYLVTAFLAFVSLAARAEGPDALTWSEEVRPTLAQIPGLFPRRVLFLAALDEASFADFGASLELRPALETSCYIERQTVADLEWELRLNRVRVKPRGLFRLIFDLAPVDTVAVAGGLTPKIIMRPKNDLVDVPITTPAPEEATTDASVWLLTQLHWNGVVLDRRGDYILIGSCAVYLKEKTQGIALKDSAQKIGVPPGDKSSDNLLQMVGKSGHFGVFKVIFSRSKNDLFPVGTKVLLER